MKILVPAIAAELIFSLGTQEASWVKTPSKAAVSCRDVSLMGTVFAKEEEKVVLSKNGDRELSWPSCEGFKE
ncbi:MAG: hypothetical protein QNK82_14940 [Akkermansiaceae bacterium]|jgi:hypothetical protein|tara:strand:- start:5897 stop:6112 length:216 start_codon:yes stop_codon:yes gene_type:complete